MKRPLKYGPLVEYFQDQPGTTTALAMTFQQIQGLLSSPLPRSAFTYSAWWLDHSAKTTHVQALAWMRAGWRVDAGDLDLAGQKVTFRRNQGDPS